MDDVYHLPEPDSFDEFLLPVACSCMKRFRQDLTGQYSALVASGISRGDALTQLGIQRWCCRSTLLAPPVLPSSTRYPSREERAVKEKDWTLLEQFGWSNLPSGLNQLSLEDSRSHNSSANLLAELNSTPTSVPVPRPGFIKKPRIYHGTVTGQISTDTWARRYPTGWVSEAYRSGITNPRELEMVLNKRLEDQRLEREQFLSKIEDKREALIEDHGAGVLPMVLN